MTTATLPTAEDYARVFHEEQCREYPVIDAFEAQCGFAIDREKLEAAARVLACPVKNNPPNWQHGRVIYASARRYLLHLTADVCASCAYQYGHARNCAMNDAPKVRAVPQDIAMLDIGTAKAFSAMCALWALEDSGRVGTVTSVDVIAPTDRVSRNSSADIDGACTLAELLAPWPESLAITFKACTGYESLSHGGQRIHFAFVDGKHDARVVSEEARLLRERQHTGDLAIFDDVHIPGVWSAVKAAKGYDVERIDLLPNRAYAVGMRR